MALDTVADYVSEARTLLQDTFVPYRYTDDQLKAALGYAIYEARRMRPDLFLGLFDALPDIKAGTSSALAVAIDPQYRMPMVYFMCSHMHLRDEEEAAEQRTAGFRNLFVKSLLAGAA